MTPEFFNCYVYLDMHSAQLLQSNANDPWLLYSPCRTAQHQLMPISQMLSKPHIIAADQPARLPLIVYPDVQPVLEWTHTSAIIFPSAESPESTNL